MSNLTIPDHARVMPVHVFVQTFIVLIIEGGDGTAIPVDDRNPARDAQAIHSEADGFYYHDRIIAVLDWNRQDVVTKSEPRNHSNNYYVDAAVRTADDIRADASLGDRRAKILGDMESVGCKRAVVTRTGRILPFEPKIASTIYTD